MTKLNSLYVRTLHRIAGAGPLQEGLELIDGLCLQIYERAKAFGGVWRDSVWPGSGVDVPIHLCELLQLC